MKDTELTILSLLAQGPRYGHEVQQIIDERGMREWLAIGYSSVYYLLNKFERQNLLTSELRPAAGGTPRKLFRLTDAGQGILRTAVSDLLRMPQSIGTGFELGLANLHVLSPKQVYQVLHYHREDLEDQVNAVRALWQERQASSDADNRHDLRALYTHSIKRMESDIEWLTEFLADWEKRYPEVSEDFVTRDQADAQSMNTAQTRLHRQTPTNPLKMLQRLQRPSETKSADNEDADT
ncbi:MAG: PadR family transcriptional regulator [Chloroflexota bacterium]